MLMTLLGILPLVGGILTGILKAFFWFRTIRAPKDKKYKMDATPISNQEIIYRFTSDHKTTGAGLLSPGFSHVVTYTYVEDSIEVVGQHEWIREERDGFAARRRLVRHKDRDLCSRLARPEGVKAISSKVRLPVKGPWLPRFAFSPGGAGIAKKAGNIYDPWVWTPRDIWEIERPCTVSRAERLYRLRSRKLRMLFFCFMGSFIGAWIASEDLIFMLSLMLFIPTALLVINHIWKNGIPSMSTWSRAEVVEE